MTAKGRNLKHGTVTGYSYGCRCDECRGAATARARIRHARNRQIELPPGDPRHGQNGYNNLSCRCSICKAANVETNKNARLRRKQMLESGEITRSHGVYTTYANYGCRCELCKDADRKRVAALKERKRQKAA